MTKYRNKKTMVYGILFQSEKEAMRYIVLRNDPYVRDLRLQVRFKLVVNGILICTYVADFTYCREHFVVEDVKGVKTRDYRIKKNLMKAVYGIDILET